MIQMIENQNKSGFDWCAGQSYRIAASSRTRTSTSELRPGSFSKRWGKGHNLFARQVVAIIISITFGFVLPADAQNPEEYFKSNCVSCHRIGGGRLIGPDLKDVTQRKDRAWLIQFMQNPQAMIDSGDPYALQLQKEANGVIMYAISGMTKELARKLLDYIETQSKDVAPRDTSAKIVVVASVSQDPEQGDSLFTGPLALGNGGPPCISCHTGMGPNIGGSLGPDLSEVFKRFQGREALVAWLSSPPTATMRSVFLDQTLQPEEIGTLVDLFERWSQFKRSYNHDSFMVWTSVVFYCFGGGVLCLLVIGGAWRGRFRSVRRPLVTSVNERGRS